MCGRRPAGWSGLSAPPRGFLLRGADRRPDVLGPHPGPFIPDSAGNAATYADDVQRATGMPVFDFLSMIAFRTGGLQRTFREQSRDALTGWAH